ncbi:MAG: PEP-CTERM sorting domain-containing protein [Chroococcidiopsidaceae cyanobacterium CP_BM_RX_35]|nr:PEP-CTERM sorting domain-containing protein [Chroococcidiopsidaceae cyanobacterium CP_BM_RX_35]
MKRSSIECYSVKSTPKNHMSQTIRASIRGSLGIASAALSLSLTVVLPSRAATISYSGDTTGQATFHRPQTPGFEGTTANPTTALSSNGTNVPYFSQPFFVDTTGAYDIAGTQNFDGVQFLYQNSFDPTNSLTNLVSANDSFPNASPSGATSSFYGFPLTAGSQYFLVTSGFDNNSFGTFTNTISGPISASSPSKITLGTVPEPSSVLGTTAFGILRGGLMLKRKLKKQKLA